MDEVAETTGAACRVDEAVAAAVGALRRRERTVSEAHAWLRGAGFGDDDSGEAIARLVEIGELDDERFALAFAEDKRALSGWGSERIETALRERGVASALAERAAGAEYAEELRRAVELLAARAAAPGDERGKGRALNYLTRRGYPYEIAYDAVNEVAAGAP